MRREGKFFFWYDRGDIMYFSGSTVSVSEINMTAQ